MKMTHTRVIHANLGMDGMHQTISMENCGDAKSAEEHSAQNAS